MCGISLRFASFVLILLSSSTSLAESRIGGNIAPDGEEIGCDLPLHLRVKNRGGSDGAGLCVFASLKHSAVWQHVIPLESIFEWMWNKPGGGWPEKVDTVIKQICSEKNAPVPAYVNYTGKDLELLRVALANGHMPGVTYYYSPSGRYSGQRISHMVSLVHLRGNWVGILDNNFPGEIEWIDVETFKNVCTGGAGKNFWAVIFLQPGPPPVPRNP